MQVQRQSALPRPFEIARPAHPQVGLRQLETVVGRAHHLYAFARFLAQFVAGHQYAVRLLGAAPDPSAQLVKLRQSKALCTLDHHHRGVGDIYSHLDYRRGDQYVGLAAHEQVHVEGFVLRSLLAVNHRGDVVGLPEIVGDVQIALLQVLVVHLFRFLDERIHYEYLPPGVNLLAHEFVDFAPLVLAYVGGDYGLASRGEFVYHRHVEVAVESHRKGAGDGGRRHHQDVRRNLRFGPQSRPLVHTEAMLLVYHRQPQIGELHLVFYQGVCAEHQVDGAVGQTGIDLATLFGLGAAGEQGDLDFLRVDIPKYAVIMLCGKHLRGGHDAGLIAVVDGLQGGKNGHHGLAAAHVALQQAVHLTAAGHVGADFLEHTLLSPCEREGKVRVCIIEGFAYAREHDPLGVAHLDEFLLDKRQLQVKQLFVFEAAASLLEAVHVGREVDVVQGLVQRDQFLLQAEILRQGFGYLACHQTLQFLLQLGEGLVGDAAALQLFGAGIDSADGRSAGDGGGRDRLYLGMDKVVAVVEHRRFAKYHIFLTYNEFVLYPLDAFEEYQLYVAGAVAKHRNQAGGLARAGERHALDGAAQLDVGAGRIYLADCIELAAVDIPEGKSVDQVAEGAYTEFFLQQLGALGPDSRQKLDFAVQYVPAHS